MIHPVPYRGDEPYIFISYAHKDADRVWPIVARLQMDGYRVWYDEGIDPGTEWDENIASHVRECGYFLAFLSESYLQSDNCKDELNYARDLEKKQVLIYLEDVHLPAGIALRFGRFQNFRADRPGFFGRLYEAEGIKAFTTGKKIRSKKWILPAVLSIAAVIAAALVLPGMLQKEEPPQPETQPEITEPATTEPAEEPFIFRKTTFLRSDAGVKLTAQSLSFNEDGDLVLDVLVENTSAIDVTLGFHGAYLNGVRCDGNVHIEAPAGRTEQAQLYWPAENLAASGFGDIRDVTCFTLIDGHYQVEREGMGAEEAQFVYYPYGQGNATEYTYAPDPDDIVIVDREDYRLIMTDRYLDEEGSWVGEFVHSNLSDRHLSATFAIEETNGYVYGDYNVEYIRAGQTVCSRVILDEWQVTQQDTVRRIDGYYWLWDSAAQAWIGNQTPVTVFPEGDADITFPLRELDADDRILVENDYIRLALIEEYHESSKYYAWRVYCVNLSDETVRVDLVNVQENGEPWYDWYIGTMEPGQQCFSTEGYYHDGKTNKELLTGELVVTRDSYYYDEEYSRDKLRLEFSW